MYRFIIITVLFSVTLVMSRGLLSYFFGAYSNFIVLISFPFPFLVGLFRGKFNNFPFKGILAIVTLYISYLLLLLLKSEGLFRGFFGLSLLAFYYVLFYAILFSVKLDKSNIFKFFNTVMLFIFWYLSVFCFYEIIFDQPISNMTQYPTPESMRNIFPSHRMSSSIGTTLPFSVTYSYVVIYMFSKYLYTRKFKYFLCLLIGLFIIFGAYNRGGIGMTILGISIILLRKNAIYIKDKVNFKKLFKTIFIIGLVFVAIIALLIIFLPDEAIQRFYDIFDWSKDKSNLKRFHHWVIAIQSIESWDEWIFGKSLGATGNSLQYIGLKSLLLQYSVTESYYLKLLVDTGLVGLFLFWVLLLYILKKAYCFKVKYNTKNEEVVKSYMFPVLFAHCVQMAFLQSLESTSVAFLFVFTISFVYLINQYAN